MDDSFEESRPPLLIPLKEAHELIKKTVGTLATRRFTELFEEPCEHKFLTRFHAMRKFRAEGEDPPFVGYCGIELPDSEPPPDPLPVAKRSAGELEDASSPARPEKRRRSAGLAAKRRDRATVIQSNDANTWRTDEELQSFWILTKKGKSSTARKGRVGGEQRMGGRVCRSGSRVSIEIGWRFGLKTYVFCFLFGFDGDLGGLLYSRRIQGLFSTPVTA